MLLLPARPRLRGVYMYTVLFKLRKYYILRWRVVVCNQENHCSKILLGLQIWQLISVHHILIVLPLIPHGIMNLDRRCAFKRSWVTKNTLKSLSGRYRSISPSRHYDIQTSRARRHAWDHSRKAFWSIESGMPCLPFLRCVIGTHSASITGSVCLLIGWLVGWFVGRFLVTPEWKIAENVWNHQKNHPVHHSCYSSFHSLSYTEQKELGIGLMEVGIGLRIKSARRIVLTRPCIRPCLCIYYVVFLVACYATLHPALSVRPSVRPSVDLSVRRSVTLYFFGDYGVFGYTTPAQILHWPQIWPLPTRTRLG